MKLLTVVGARPNFMKAAPLHWAVEAWNKEGGDRIEHLIVHTGQHYDMEMSGVFFESLKLPVPTHSLSIGSGSQATQVGNAMIALEKIFMDECSDWVVVVGDVNASLSATLAAKKLQLPVAHVEAGLRSGDWTMPEEINRILVDRVADLLLAPGEGARANLLREGTDPDLIAIVGNIMIDTLEVLKARLDNTPKQQTHPAGPYAVLTLHRPSNVDNREVLVNLMECLGNLSREMPVYFPIHPRTRRRLEEFNLGSSMNGTTQVHLMDPLDYPEMLTLTRGASIVLTDSGGLQEESTVLGIPCVTLRTTTERPETLVENGGTALLAGQDPGRIKACIAQLITSPPNGKRPPLWDGRTGRRILELLWKRREFPLRTL